MIVDARDLPHGTDLRADVCIVGTGPAGMTVALELEGRGLDVIVVESGGFDFDPDLQDLYEVQMTGEQFGPEEAPIPVSATRLRHFGGTSNHWAGYCRPLRPVDMEPRPGLGRPGWPISHDELAAHYDRALEILDIGPNRFDLPYWNEQAGLGPALVDDDVVETVVFQLSQVRFSRYREPMERSTDVRVVLHANVVGVVPAESGATVEHLAVETMTGRSHTVTARRYVLALGGIETARLLLASARDRGGVGNGRDLVGRGFTEHGQNTLGFATMPRSVEDLRAYGRSTVAAPTGRGPDGELVVQSALVLSDETLRREELLGMEAQLFFVADDEDPPEARFGPGVRDVADLVRRVSGSDPRTIVGLQVTAEQAPHAESRITLTDEVDALGMPRATLHWTVSDDDRRSILRGLEIMATRLGLVGAGRVQRVAGGLGRDGTGGGLFGRFTVDPRRTDPTGFHLAHANHHCCTVSMSSDPSTGVCDRDLKVWGFDDLHLAGSGVFPTAGVTSPTINIVALSVRLAQHLRRQLT